MIARIGLVSMIAGGVWAQSVQPPAIGYVYDASRQGVRSVTGIMGSARAGEVFGPILQKGVVSSLGGYAVGISGDGSSVLLLKLQSRESSFLMSAAKFGMALLSPQGSAAALVSADGMRVDVWKDLSSSARLDNSVSGWGIDEKVLAVNDAGDVVVTSDGSNLFAYEGGTQKQLFHGRKIESAAFVPNSRHLLAADSEEAKLYLLRDLLQLSVLANVATPGALNATVDGKQALVVTGARVVSIRIADGLVETAECSCEPSAVELFGGEALFRLTDGSSGPIWLIDGRNLQTAFVPKPEVSNE